jgi:hypothetical protein
MSDEMLDAARARLLGVMKGRAIKKSLGLPEKLDSLAAKAVTVRVSVKAQGVDVAYEATMSGDPRSEVSRLVLGSMLSAFREALCGI